MDEVKVERVLGGYIVTYFDDNARYIREAHTTHEKVVRAVASILATMDGKQLGMVDA